MRKLRKVIFSLTLLALCAGSFADDTDIFLGNGQYQQGTLPNVLFVIDNSGSMDEPAKNADGSLTGQTRMQALKTAFNDLMQNISGVNVGVMRFNTPGGSVLYPVTNIDAPLPSEAFQTQPDMLLSGDDAVELGSTGAVSVADSTLKLGFSTSASTTTYSVTSYVVDQEDNREELVSTGASNNGFWMDMDSTQLCGLRYLNMNIPRGASIQSAYLEMTSPVNNSSGSSDILIRGQNADNPARFTGANYDLANRLSSQATTAYVNWNIPDAQPWVTGNRYNSADITSIVQELVSRPDWDNNDAMVFLFDQQSGGYRSGTLFRTDSPSTQGASGSNTKLIITYTLTTPGVENTVGLRFEEVSIPQGATITSAYLRFHAAQAHSADDDLELKVRAESSDNAAPFTNSSFGLSARSKLATEVIWSPEASWPLDTLVTGADITPLVQQVVDRSGWCGNNAMAFYLQPRDTSAAGGSRLAYSYDEVSHRHPELVINYTSNGSGCMNSIWNKRTIAIEDDASENNDKNKTVTNSASSLTLGNSQKLGMRFQSLPFARGTTVIEAYLEFTAKANSSGSFYVDLYAHDTNNSAAFPNSRGNISGRTRTSATARWNISDNWQTDYTYRSPELKTLIQEVFDRGSWNEGNALSLVVYGSSGATTRSIYSFDGSGARAPKLVIKVASTPSVSAADLTVRGHINSLVQNLDARTFTPIVDTLYESALYYRGAEVYYGADRQIFDSGDGLDLRYKRVSVENSYTGGTHVMPASCSEDNLDSTNCRDETITNSPSAPTYISPIVSDCQSNHIVLFTDGEANHNNSQGVIGTLIGNSSCGTDTSRTSEKCGRSLAQWMAENDMQASLPTTNTISTHTIAFNLSNASALNFLRDLATRGNGGAYTANTSAELTDAFSAIIRNIVSRDSTFTAPGATVNQFNRLSNRSEIYFSVFKPEATPLWPGNLKRYKLLGDPAVISDANDQAAVDSNTGFFKDTAKSIWSTTADGADVEAGGAAQRLNDTPTLRKLYTYLPAATANTPSLSLTAAANKFSYANADITNAMMQAADTAERNNILLWAMGFDMHDVNANGSTTDARKQLGDPLHSIPLLITYSGPSDTPDITAFFGTNEGFLHAVDADNGDEVFSFIPKALFGNLKTLYDNNMNFTHPYGMDGSPTAWIQDLDFDNTVNNSDKVYVYTGMRSGGRNLYALDVTTRSAPKMLWTLEGGSGDFSALGYTWSRPVKTKVKIGSQVKDVLVFAGGFDPIIDANPTHRVNATMGNSIYMVDATTGERLWMAGNNVLAGQGLNLTAMKYAIPGDLSVLDVNKDGLIDMMFVGNTGGQVWRFDFHQGESASDLVTGGIIADLAGDTQATDRRFHFKPDVSLFGDQGNLRMAVSIGSGSLQEPLEQTTQNRFYVLFQDDIFSAPATYTTLNHTHLTDRTDDITETRITNSGWYIDLEARGEKTLASSLTVNNQIILTTYTPETAVSACSGVTGVGRVYLVDLYNGKPSQDLDDSGTLTKEDRSRTLKAPSIPPTPKMLFPEETDAPTILVGPEQPLLDVDLGVNRGFQRTYWYEPDGSTY
jgi:type IV pilus assembly protein PilY1